MSAGSAPYGTHDTPLTRVRIIGGKTHQGPRGGRLWKVQYDLSCRIRISISFVLTASLFAKFFSCIPGWLSLFTVFRWWILYSQGRVWVYHPSSAKGHCQFSFPQWLTQFFIVCLCMQMSGGEKSHCQNGDWQWQSPPICSSSGLNSSSGGELKLYLG